MDANFSTMTMPKTMPVQNLLRYISFKRCGLLGSVFDGLNQPPPTPPHVLGLNFSLLFRLVLAILSIHSAKMVAENTPKFIPPIGPKVWCIDRKRLNCASVHVLLVSLLSHHLEISYILCQLFRALM